MSNARPAAYPDDRDYLTVDEFAALPSESHHAVWGAHSAGQVEAVPASAAGAGGMLRYHRTQVRALLRDLEAGAKA